MLNLEKKVFALVKLRMYLQRVQVVVIKIDGDSSGNHIMFMRCKFITEVVINGYYNIILHTQKKITEL